MPDRKCKKCGAKVSDQYSYCTNCQTPFDERLETTDSHQKQVGPAKSAERWLSEPIEKERKRKEKKRCVNCGVEILTPSDFCLNCGHPLKINISEVLHSSISIIKRKPIVILPIFLTYAISSFAGLYLNPLHSWNLADIGRLLTWVAVLISISLVVQPVTYGMYPLMVSNVLHGREITLAKAFRKAVRRYPSLFVSGVLVMLLLIVGSFLLIIPAIYWELCYYCTYPAIMLEEHGTLDGMSASKRFSQNRKWQILDLLVIIHLPTVVAEAILGLSFVRGTLLYSVASSVVQLTIGLFSGVMSTVLSSYIYIRYGMSK